MPSRKHNHKKYSAMVTVFVFVFIFIAMNVANAQIHVSANDGWCNALLHPIDCTLEFIQGSIYTLIAAVGSMLNWALNMRVTDIAVVEQAWETIRNFANMFFIVALIIMAFGTLFNLQGYNFRRLIVSFLIVALLINFSLTIGETIIDISQSLANVFINSIGDAGLRVVQATQIISTIAGKAVEIDKDQIKTDTIKIIKRGGDIGETTQDLADAGLLPHQYLLWGNSRIMFLNIIMGMIILFSLGVALVFSIIRVPILWALLITAPMAWILAVLPSTKGANSWWWTYFIGWNVFLPAYLFFIYFGSLFLVNGVEIVRQISSSGTEASFATGLGIQLQVVFLYVLTAVFLIGGAKLAMGWSMAAGAKGVAASIWGKGYFGRLGSTVGYGWKGTGVPGAWEARRKQWKEEGYRVPGTQARVFGEQQLREREAKVGALFGVRGKELQIKKEFVNRSEEYYKDLKEKLDLGKVKVEDIQQKAATGSASNPETYATRKTLAERGQLEQDLYAQTLTELTDNSFAAQDFAKIAKENIKPDEMLKMVAGEGDYGAGGAYDMMSGNLSPAKRELVKKIMSNPEAVNKMTESQYGKAIDLFGGKTTKESRDFVKAIGDIRPDIGIEYQMSNTDWAEETRRKEEYQDIVSQPWTQLRKDMEIKTRMYEVTMKSTKETADRHIKVWTRPDFQRALLAIILRLQNDNPDAARRFTSRLYSDLAFSKDREAKTQILNIITGGRPATTAGGARTRGRRAGP